jgi:hypothetical protein
LSTLPIEPFSTMTERGGFATDYNRHKEPAILEIYERMFRALVP